MINLKIVYVCEPVFERSHYIAKEVGVFQHTSFEKRPHICAFGWHDLWMLKTRYMLSALFTWNNVLYRFKVLKSWTFGRVPLRCITVRSRDNIGSVWFACLIGLVVNKIMEYPHRQILECIINQTSDGGQIVRYCIFLNVSILD